MAKKAKNKKQRIILWIGDIVKLAAFTLLIAWALSYAPQDAKDAFSCRSPSGSKYLATTPPHAPAMLY